jgi:hypothetical protein
VIDIYIMGCKNTQPKPKGPKHSKPIDEMITKLHKLGVIGFNSSYQIDNEKSLIKINKLLRNFIQYQKVCSLKDVIHIIFLLINMVESIIDIRSKYDLRFTLINFDKIYYDRYKDKLVLNDFGIKKNYQFNTIIVDSFVMNKKLKFSLQPYFYSNTVCEYYIKSNLCTDYTLEKCIKFYSFMFINFFKVIFSPANNDLMYEKFRKNVLFNINDVFRKRKELSLENAKNVFVDALICNETLGEVINSFISEDNTGPDTCRLSTSEI